MSKRVITASLALGAVLASAASAPSGAATSWTATGHGFGHGVGMSQWGAYGYAKHGFTEQQILKHYFTGTSLGTTANTKVRVLLLARAPNVGFGGARAACGKRLDPAKSYQAVRSGSAVILKLKTKTIAKCGAALGARGGGKLTVAGKLGRTYRGSLDVRPAAGAGLNAINVVALEQYVDGVVPNEVPSSWPGAALRAQAIAARSYGLATLRAAGVSQVYDDTRDQVYGGRGTETGATNAAVKATAFKVVNYGGHVATTFFSSASGGQTENVEFGLGSSPQPYLKGVADPYDGSAPLHNWTRSISDATMQAALGGLVRGNLTSIEVTKTGASPRIVKATLHGTGGDATVSGATIRRLLGLPSTWVRFTAPS